MKFPYDKLIHQILFTVMELPPGKEKVDSFDKNLVKATSVLKEHKEVSVRVKLPKGRYVIVPTTRNPGEYGSYTLSIYMSVGMEFMMVEGIDKPTEIFSGIREETENLRVA